MADRQMIDKLATTGNQKTSAQHPSQAVLDGKCIVFVGGGNMAGALLDGLLASGSSAKLGVIDKNQNKLNAFAKKGIATALPDAGKTLLLQADIVVLAVKPQVLSDVCADIQENLQQTLIVSVVAGVSFERLQAMTGNCRVVRSMPNLPVAVGLGATGLYTNDASDDDKAAAAAIMGAAGITVWVDNEALLHAVTAVAGSAPAYFFYLLGVMIDKGVALGLETASAKKLAVQAMLGSAVMAKDGDIGALQAQVMSKGGTTYAAISTLEATDVGGKLAAAMQACYDRSVELGA